MKSNFHISKNDRKVGGTAHLLHKQKLAGGIHAFEESLREEGRQEIMNGLRPYYNQLERVEQKLDKMMEQQGLSFKPKMKRVK
ncbi:hypothetical protein WQ57_05430 [Mesobacillus campisalis]|uniref:Uncharacterized protein n=1 Tax=Mesobacillus campisalis TaxID=1408103 RepID=A0A0M2SXA1_9BACI|nr:hypothetical protein [Mesobacillus campisalis]KKK39204.1 hypothetical protein WQ57_05430 [Mesobacillus campisalis]